MSRYLKAIFVMVGGLASILAFSWFIVKHPVIIAGILVSTLSVGMYFFVLNCFFPEEK